MLCGLRPAKFPHKAYKYEAGAKLHHPVTPHFKLSVLSNSRGCDWIERRCLSESFASFLVLVRILYMRFAFASGSCICDLPVFCAVRYY